MVHCHGKAGRASWRRGHAGACWLGRALPHLTGGSRLWGSLCSEAAHCTPDQEPGPHHAAVSDLGLEGHTDRPSGQHRQWETMCHRSRTRHDPGTCPRCSYSIEATSARPQGHTCCGNTWSPEGEQVALRVSVYPRAFVPAPTRCRGRSSPEGRRLGARPGAVTCTVNVVVCWARVCLCDRFHSARHCKTVPHSEMSPCAGGGPGGYREPRERTGREGTAWPPFP